MRWRIFLIFIAAFTLFFGFSPGASAQSQSLGQCNTSYSREQSGDCGVSCPSLCDKATEKQKCLDALKTDTDLWNKYELTETQTADPDPLLRLWYYDYYFEPVSTNVSINRICSTGDKLCSEATSCSATPKLYAGQCDCSVNNVAYKTCCLITNPASKDYSKRESWTATSSGDVDNIPPPEGFCSGTNVETVLDFNGASCPQPPVITLTGNGTSDRLKIANNTPVKLEWTINGYDKVVDTNITGVANYPRSGSYPATDSSPSYIPFKTGTKAGTEDKRYINAQDDYLVPCTTSDSGCSEKVLSEKTLILVSTGDNLPSCPLILDQSCGSYDNQPKLPPGQTAPDGTDNDYSKSAKKYITLDKTKFAPIPAGKSCCSLPACSRCSNSPATSGKFASWTGMPDNTCNGDWSTVKYSPEGGGSDLRCSIPPSEACVIDGLYISPTTLQKGKNTNISWDAKPNPKTPEDLIESCEMTAKDSKGEKKTPEKASEFSKSFGPITEDTTYWLKCTGLSKKTCETPPVTVKIGISCEITNFSSDGSKISDTEYETTSSSTLLKWQVKDSDLCKINGSQAAPAAEGSKSYSSLSKGSNSFKLSCETKNNESVLCEKTITVKRTDAPSPGQCSVDSFTANPSSINQKDRRTSTLSWTTTKASGCTLLGKSFGPADSYVVSPDSPSTTYTVTCTTSESSSTCSKSLTIPVTPPPASSCVGSYSDVSINVSASPQCLPSQPGYGANTVVSYGASAGSSCASAIGGGSPSNSNISCTTPGWNPSSGKQTVSPSRTTSYSVSCSRPGYTCSRSDQTFTSGTKSENSSACESARTAALKNPSVASATCVNTGCTRYYTSSSYKDRGTTCTSDYSKCTSTGSCKDRKPKGYCSRTYSSCTSSSDCIQAESCKDKKCERSGNACTSSADCTQAESCQNIKQIGTCDNGGGSCGYNEQYPNSDCTYQYDCESNYKCNSYACIKDSGGTYYEGYRLDVTSKPICGSSSSNSTQVRVITKPNSPTLTAEGAKNVSGNIYQILLNHFFNLSWSVSAPDSLVSTILRCTASGKGDSEMWDGKGLNGFSSSGNIYDLFERKSYLSPNVSTTYYLWCRNQDSIFPNSCYNDGPTNSVEVKVYTPDLQEKGPSSFNFVKKFMGMIGGGW